jgi:hypothetical protein
MILRRFAFCFLFAFLILGGLAGCKQGLDQRCQVDSDCDEGQGLKCILPQGGSAAEGGTCRPNTTVSPDMMVVTQDMTVATQDSATGPDLSQTGGQDQAVAPDLTTSPDGGGSGDM